MKNPTIYDISNNTRKNQPYFFSNKTLKFFGQTMKSFKVYKNPSNRIFIYALMYAGKNGNLCGITLREYDYQNQDLLMVKNQPDTNDITLLKIFLNTL